MEEKTTQEIRQNLVQDPSFLRWVLDGADVIELFDSYLAGDLVIQKQTDDGGTELVRIPNSQKNLPQYKDLLFPEPLMTMEGRNRVKSILSLFINKVSAMSEISIDKIEEMVGMELEVIAVEFASNYEKIFYDISSFERVMIQLADIMIISLLRSKNAGLREAITQRIQMSIQESREKGGIKIPFTDKYL